jgi:hypothetical protein
MGLWTNNDGLRIKLGTTEAEVGLGGELNKGGTFREFEFVVNLAGAGADPALIPRTDNIFFPKGFTISEVEVTNEVAATGTGAVLNIGLVKQSDYSSALDADGVLKAAPRTDWDAAGETKTYIVGVSGAGDLLGTPLTDAAVLTYDYDTAAFTAGRVKVVVRGYIQRPAITN